MHDVLTRFFHPQISDVYIFIAFAVYGLLHQLFLYPLFFSPLRKVPGPPFGHLLYGQFLRIVKGEVASSQSEWAEKYGAVIRPVGPFGIEHMIFLSPSALQRILVSNWSDYPRADFWRHILGISAGYGLLTHHGTEHKQMRHAMNSAFSLRNLIAQMDMYYPPIEGFTKILHERISSQLNPTAGAEVIMYEWISKVTLDIICATTLGVHPDAVNNPNHDLARSYHKLTGVQNGLNMARMMAFVSIPGGAEFLRSDFALRYRDWWCRGPLFAPGKDVLPTMHCIRAFTRTVVADRIAEGDGVQSKRDIMSLLVQARMNKTGEEYILSEEILAENAVSFLSAGHTTTASGVTWALWLLANDVAAQNRLRAEVTPLVAESPRPGHRGLMECQWLHCVLMETLRLFPSIPMVMRQADKSDYVEGVYIPKGTQVYIPIRVVNTWSQIWGDDAKEFRPDRWLSLPPAYNTKFSFLSFTAGPHACIGRTMAMMQMKAILATLIAHFAFAPAYEGQVAGSTAAVTMKPADDMPLRVTLVGALPMPE